MSGGHVKQQEQTGMVPETVYSRISELLGTPIMSEADVWHFVKRGISTERYVFLAERLRLPPNAVASARTVRRRVKMLERRAKPGQSTARQVERQQRATAALVKEARMTPVETERLMRIVRVVSEATQFFGDEAAALSWLNAPGDFLHGENKVTPMKLAGTDSGARMIESMIQRTAYGFF